MKLKKRRARKIAIVIIAAAVISMAWIGRESFLSVETLERHRWEVLSFVSHHFELAVSGFFVAYVLTAFFVPGTLVLTLTGGFLFGTIVGSIIIFFSAFVGSALSFFLARILFADWVQERYQEQLEQFNAEVERNGSYYLVMLRLVPVFPFFLVNYLAGITTIPPGRYFLSTLAGMLPGIVVHAFAGEQLRRVRHVADVLSPSVSLALALVGLLALVPALASHMRRKG